MAARTRCGICGKAVFLFYLLTGLLAACAGSGAPTPAPFAAPTSVFVPLPSVNPAATSLFAGPIPTPGCSANLLFLQDLTVPDGTVVPPRSSLDKQWLVQNVGSCNWDNRYRIRFLDGDPLGAPTEQALYPARSGSQAVIRMIFTAPADAGNYLSEWRAYDADNIAFGDTFFIKFTVGQ